MFRPRETRLLTIRVHFVSIASYVPFPLTSVFAVHPESRHVQEMFNNKGKLYRPLYGVMFTDSEYPQIGNNNNVSAKRSSWVEGQSLGWSEIFAIPSKKDTRPASKKMSLSIPTESMFFYRLFVCF